jgi:carbonyl reductase 1
MSEYAHAVKAGSATAEGWPEWINIASKVGQVAAMRILARDERERAPQDGRFIAAVCPGLVDTDASRPWFSDMSQAEEAATDVLALVFDSGEPSFYGELIQHCRIVPWR